MRTFLASLSILTSFVASAQSIEINPNGGTNASAILDLKSTTKGFLLPRMTNAQMRAIPSPAQGLLAFCADCGTNGDYYFYKGADWVALGSTTVSVSTTVGSVGLSANENGATITDGVLNLAPADATNPGIVTKTAQTFAGVKTFSNGIVGNVTGNVTGNASTVTTNANLTGVVTSTGNATSISNGVISNAMLANGAVANLSGTNTGDNAVNSLYSGLVTNATHTGDVTGSTALTISNNAVTNAKIAAGAITDSKVTDVAASKITGTLAVANGGTGSASLTANNLLVGNGTSAVLTIAPSINNNILVANGTNWVSSTLTINQAGNNLPFSILPPYLPVRYCIALQGIYPTRNGGDPFIGEIEILPYNFAPTGWADCDGSIVAIAQNAALFSLLGTFYGGNGTTTFALPDLRGRFPIGQGQRPGFSNYQIGQTGGSETTTLLQTNLPAHTHTVSYN